MHYGQRITGEATARQVLRNGRMWPLTLAIGVVFLLQGSLNSSPALTPFFLILGPFAIFLALWPRLILTADGVTIVNFGSRSLRWDEIRGAEARSRRGTVNLVISTDDGELRSLAMRGSAGGIVDSRPTVERVAAQITEARRLHAGPVGVAGN